MFIPYDVALAIVQRIARSGNGLKDYPTLAAFALVNRACALASAKALYAGVIVTPSTDFIVSLWARSSLLSYNVAHVTSLTLEGNLNYRVPELDSTLADAIRTWPNLSIVVFDPPAQSWQTSQTFPKIADALIERHASLRKLLLGGAATILYGRRESLPPCPVLEELLLQSPARTILQLIPEWLGGGHSSKLTRFEISGYTYHVDSSELRRLAETLQNITVLSLDHSDRVGHHELVTFLGALPRLSRFTLNIGRSYMQQFANPVKRVPALSSLASLTLKHHLAKTTLEAATFCTLVRRLVAGSRLREFVSITTDQPWREDCPAVAHDALLYHISSRHPNTFETLSATTLFFRHHAVTHLTQTCTRLRDINLATGPPSILNMIYHRTSLTSVSINMQKRVNRPTKDLTDDAEVQDVFAKTPTLTHLRVNELMWRRGIDGAAPVEVVQSQSYRVRHPRW